MQQLRTRPAVMLRCCRARATPSFGLRAAATTACRRLPRTAPPSAPSAAPLRQLSSTAAQGEERLAGWLAKRANIRGVFDLSLVPRSELAFTQYPIIPGHRRTLGALFGLNFLVFVGWRYASLEHSGMIEGDVDPDGEPGDSPAMRFMKKYFLWTNYWREEGRWWVALTASVSHMQMPHLVGNMALLLYLGKRLHEFLGAGRTVALYLSGAVAGSIATDLYYPKGDAAEGSERYYQILSGDRPDTVASLGASDSVMAFIACFYLTFPRHQVHVFKKLHIFRRLVGWDRFNIKATGNAEKLQAGANSQNTVPPFLSLQMSFSALWALPMYFLGDFFNVFQTTGSGSTGVNHAAHVGGFAAGSLFYLLIARPRKVKYFPVRWDVRKWYLMTVTLGMWGLFFEYLRYARRIQSQKESAHPAFLFRTWDLEDEDLYRLELGPVDRELVTTMSRASLCSAAERSAAMVTNDQKPLCGACDELFKAAKRELDLLRVRDRSKASKLFGIWDFAHIDPIDAEARWMSPVMASSGSGSRLAGYSNWWELLNWSMQAPSWQRPIITNWALAEFGDGADVALADMYIPSGEDLIKEATEDEPDVDRIVRMMLRHQRTVLTGQGQAWIVKTEQPEAVKTFGVAALERLPDIIEAEVQARLAELDRLIADPGVVRDKVTTFVLANSDETDTNGEEIKRQHCEALAMFWKASTRGLLGDTLNTITQQVRLQRLMEALDDNLIPVDSHDPHELFLGVE